MTKQQLINEILQDAKMYGEDLTQMYQAGYLDGINRKKKKKKGYNAKIQADCLRAFQERFVNRLNEQKA